MALTQDKRRLYGIQILRAIAAFLVVVRHLGLELSNNFSQFHIPHLITALTNGGQNGVDIFFVISGFIMVYVSKDHLQNKSYSKSFFIRRLTRIVPVYWFYSTLFVAVIWADPASVHNNSITLAYLIKSYLFIPAPNPVTHAMQPVYGLGWTLNYEMFFYLLFAVAIAVSGLRTLATIAVVFIGLAIAGYFVSPDSVALWYWTRPIILEFLCGGCIAYAWLRNIVVPSWARPICVGIAIIWWALAWIDGATSLIAGALPAVLIVAAIVPWDCSMSQVRVYSTLLMVGDASYSLYLCHMFVIRAVTIATTNIDVSMDARVAIECVGVIILAPIVATISYRTIERPFIKIGRRYLTFRE